MEYLIVIAIFAIILLCLGFSIGEILMMFAGLLCLLIVLTGLFFVFALAVLLTSRKTTAVFVEMDEKGRYPSAVYKTERGNFKNLFPGEMVMKKRLYVPEKEVIVRKCAFLNSVLDKNAVMTIILGNAVFIPLSVAAVFAAKWLFGF